MREIDVRALEDEEVAESAALIIDLARKESCLATLVGLIASPAPCPPPT
jgi:hypothetical protein